MSEHCLCQQSAKRDFEPKLVKILFFCSRGRKIYSCQICFDFSYMLVSIGIAIEEVFNMRKNAVTKARIGLSMSKQMMCDFMS
ncbi:hypothetical protein C8235_06635 [Paracidovorax avenae]|nr:hypothetical protein C8235_06635 [Paracidovorax avenae]